MPLHTLIARTLGAFAFAATLVAQASPAPIAPDATKLRVFFIDVEGGQATLFVAPSGQSLLVDTGWSGRGARDAERIVVTIAHQAGLTRIDTVLITHFHEDHVGGVPQLVARIPVGTFIDHGINREVDNPQVVSDFQAYQAALASTKAMHITAHVGEPLAIPGFDATVLSADGNVLSTPLPGAGQPNPFCAASETRPTDTTENSRSLGIELTFGKLRLLDLGDLTWDKEMQMMCPNNRIGQVDVLVVSHHGWYQSSSPALVDAVRPRVAIMDNGEAKGGSIPTFVTFSNKPAIKELYQLHYSKEAGAEHNRADAYIANPLGTDAGHFIELTADRDGSFDVRNERTGAVKHYPIGTPADR